MILNHRIGSRAFATVLAVVLVFTAVFVPALHASADASGQSAQLHFSASGLDISVKEYWDAKAGAMALLVSLESGGKTMMQGGIYLTADSLAVEWKPLLDRAYGINLKKAAENLPKSIFAPDSGTAYALDPETYAQILQSLTPRSTNLPEIPAEQMEALGGVFTHYGTVIGELISEHAELRMAPEKITVGSKEIATNGLTMTLAPEALAEIVSSVLTEAAGDTALRDAIALFYDIGNGSGMRGGFESGAEAAESICALLPELAEQAAQGIQDSQCSFTLTVNLAKKTQMPVRITANLNVEDESLGLRYTMGETLATSEEIALEFLEDGEATVRLAYTKLEKGFALSLEDSGNTSIVLTSQMMENNDKVFAASVNVQVTGASPANLTGTLLWDKLTQRFTIGVGERGNMTSVSGTVTEATDSITITVVSINNEPVEGMYIVLREHDSITLPEYTEILTLTEAEFSRLAGMLNVMANSVAGMV